MDVFELDGETMVGCYEIVLPVSATFADFELAAVRRAIAEGDAEQMEPDQLIAVIRSPEWVSTPEILNPDPIRESEHAGRSK